MVDAVAGSPGTRRTIGQLGQLPVAGLPAFRGIDGAGTGPA